MTDPYDSALRDSIEMLLDEAQGHNKRARWLLASFWRWLFSRKEYYEALAKTQALLDAAQRLTDRRSAHLFGGGNS